MKVQQKPGPVVDAVKFLGTEPLPDGVIPNRRNIGTFLYRIRGESYARINPGDYLITLPDGSRQNLDGRQFAETYEILEDESAPVKKKRAKKTTKKRGSVAAMSQPGRMDQEDPAPKPKPKPAPTSLFDEDDD